MGCLLRKCSASETPPTTSVMATSDVFFFLAREFAKQHHCLSHKATSPCRVGGRKKKETLRSPAATQGTVSDPPSSSIVTVPALSRSSQRQGSLELHVHGGRVRRLEQPGAAHKSKADSDIVPSESGSPHTAPSAWSQARRILHDPKNGDDRNRLRRFERTRSGSKDRLSAWQASRSSVSFSMLSISGAKGESWSSR